MSIILIYGGEPPMSLNVVQNGVRICRLRRTASSDTAKQQRSTIVGCSHHPPPPFLCSPLLHSPLLHSPRSWWPDPFEGK